MGKKYRPNVAAILQASTGRVLIGQRSDYPSSWQFPQGGIDRGETADEAVKRELAEETGVMPGTYRIRTQRGSYRYDFPGGPDRRGFDGQEQTYFLCVLEEPGEPMPDLASTCGEFVSLRWVRPDKFPINSASPMKRDVYRAVLRDFFGVAAIDSH